jgi:predicted NBD/HSP70 family sugar kinase
VRAIVAASGAVPSESVPTEPVRTEPVATEPVAAGPVVTGPASSAARAERFLDELAHRVALGAAAVCTVIDPGLIVLGGEVGLAGGTVLADRVAAEVTRLCPVRPRVVPTGVASDPVLRGALLTAVNRARADLLASVAG